MSCSEYLLYLTVKYSTTVLIPLSGERLFSLVSMSWQAIGVLAPHYFTRSGLRNQQKLVPAMG